MSLRSKYAKQVRKTFGSNYHASWLPDSPHVLGEYGRMVDDTFISYGNIADLGITFGINHDTIPSSFEITASKGVGITTKLKGETNVNLPHVPQASVGLSIIFQSEGAFIITSEETFEDRIANLIQLETQLQQLRKSGKWDSSYRIVTGILRMPSAKIIISQEDNTNIELSLNGTLTPSIKELGKASVDVTLHFESTSAMKYLPARDATPIIQLHSFSPSIFLGPPRLRTFSIDAAKESGAEEIWRITPDLEELQ